MLSKEYGLDGYLSTRIRHGTFLNHIRSVFEAHNLMSQKSSDGLYRDNEYWKDRFPQPLHGKSVQLQNEIKRFSKTIDDLTEHY